MPAETIFALASGMGRAGIAVMRVSGAAAKKALETLCPGKAFEPRVLAPAALVRPGGEVIDRALAVWIPGPKSYTGEDVAEFHIHGGAAVIAALTEALGRLDGLRPAEPGEFTRRAFLNGKMDLTAAEGLADLINAETEAQRRQALRQLKGDLGALYENWRGRLLRALAHLEASIDFIEEGLPAELEREVRRGLGGIAGDIETHLSDAHRGERLRDGLQIAIIGPPNAGKSSLINMLAKRDVAIVAATAGTTRDVIEAHLDLGGYPVILADTAGLRESGDPIEAEGVRRASHRAREADLRLAVLDATLWPAIDPVTAALIDADTLVAINKADLAAPVPPLEARGREALAVSVKTGAGVDALLAALGREVAARCRLGEAPAITRERHRKALTDCLEALKRVLAATDPADPELVAEDLRLAVRALGRITGRVDVEDLLDVIFRDFCIGK
ncbi:MAG: tRNA uridine-5-carboxymethylaminomethyl(34) synthesis GTPase MnmE [Rhodospirillales bacterium]